MQAEAAEQPDLLIRHATVVDVADGRLMRDQDISVRDGRIIAIGSAEKSSASQARETFDASGKFAIPGLWDMHVHFGGGESLIEENKNLLPLYVAHGITAVRDAAGDLSASVFQWRAEVAAGRLSGPTIFTSGPKIEGRGSIWPGDTEIGTREELNAALDRLQEWRADFVKITDDKLSPELFIEAVTEARRRGFRTSAHVPLGITIDEASAAGLNSIEHLSYAYRAGSTREREIANQFQSGEADQPGSLDADREHVRPRNGDRSLQTTRCARHGDHADAQRESRDRLPGSGQPRTRRLSEIHRSRAAGHLCVARRAGGERRRGGNSPSS